MKATHYTRVAPGLVLLCAMSQAQPAENIRLAFDIHAKQMEEALTEFAQATRLQVLFQSEVVRERAAPVVSGALTPERALQQLLANSGLRYEFINTRTVTIREDDGSGGLLRTSTSSSTESGGPETVQQEGAAQDARDQRVMEGIPQVLVRGSRSLDADIKRTEDDVQPYVVLDRSVIERSGATNVEDLLKKKLTMRYGATSSNQTVTDGSGNESSISLRGFQQNETLILVDGRRVGARGLFGDIGQGDLNGIPLSAIERIEVLPATASGIYGGGATGGVVNVILRREFSSITPTLTYGSTSRGDHEDKAGSVAGGISLNGGNTHLLFSANYDKTSALRAGDRAFVDDYIERAFQNQVAASPTFLTRGTAPPLGARTNVTSQAVAGVAPVLRVKGTNLSMGSAILSIPSGYSGVSSDGGAALMSAAGQYLLGGADSVQSSGGEQRTLLAETTVKYASVSLEHDVSSKVRLFADVSNSWNDSTADFGSVSGTFTLAANAQGNPFAQAVRVTVPLVGVDGANVTKTKALHAVLGGVFPVTATWNGEVDYSFDRTDTEQRRPPTTFTSALSTQISNGTLNVFRDLNQFPIDFSAFLTPDPGIDPTHALRNGLTLRLAGPIGTLPAGKPVVTVLLEDARQQLSPFEIRSYSSTGILQSGGRYSAGKTRNDSAYVEALVPLISGQNSFWGINSLDAQLSVRYDRYALDGANNDFVVPAPGTSDHDTFSSVNPTVGLKFQPIRDVAFRASAGTGFRPPLLGQLQEAAPLTSPPPAIPYTDPRRGGEQVGTVFVLVGGNPDLEPEKSDSLTAGMILTPTFAPRLRMSFDWVRIRKHDNITSVPQSQNSISNELAAPNTIIRAAPAPGDPFGVGRIVGFDTRSFNGVRALSESYDFALDYTFLENGSGSWNMSGAATRLLHSSKQQTVTSPFQDTAGTITAPEWNANASLTWSWKQLNLAWSAEYLDSFTLLVGGAPVVAQGSAQLGSAIYHDLYGGYRFANDDTFTSGMQIRAGVKNIFDKQPAFVTIYGGGYDNRVSPSMRELYLTVSKTF